MSTLNTLPGVLCVYYLVTNSLEFVIVQRSPKLSMSEQNEQNAFIVVWQHMLKLLLFGPLKTMIQWYPQLFATIIAQFF